MDKIKDVDDLFVAVRDITSDYFCDENDNVIDHKFYESLDVLASLIITRTTLKFLTLNSKTKKNECKLMLMGFLENAVNKCFDDVFENTKETVKKYGRKRRKK